MIHGRSQESRRSGIDKSGTQHCPPSSKIAVPTIRNRGRSNADSGLYAPMSISGYQRIPLFYPGLLPQVTEQFAIHSHIRTSFRRPRAPTNLSALPWTTVTGYRAISFTWSQPTVSLLNRRLQGYDEPSCSTLGYRLRLPSDSPSRTQSTFKSLSLSPVFLPILESSDKGGEYSPWTHRPKRTPQVPASAFALRPTGKPRLKNRGRGSLSKKRFHFQDDSARCSAKQVDRCSVDRGL